MSADVLLEFVLKSGLDSSSLYDIEVLALNVVKLPLSVQEKNVTATVKVFLKPYVRFVTA